MEPLTVKDKVLALIDMFPGQELSTLVEHYKEYYGQPMTETNLKRYIGELALDQQVYRKSEEVVRIIEQKIVVDTYHATAVAYKDAALVDTLSQPAVV